MKVKEEGRNGKGVEEERRTEREWEEMEKEDVLTR